MPGRGFIHPGYCGYAVLPIDQHGQCPVLLTATPEQRRGAWLVPGIYMVYHQLIHACPRITCLSCVWANTFSQTVNFFPPWSPPTCHCRSRWSVTHPYSWSGGQVHHQGLPDLSFAHRGVHDNVLSVATQPTKCPNGEDLRPDTFSLSGWSSQLLSLSLSLSPKYSMSASALPIIMTPVGRAFQ